MGIFNQSNYFLMNEKHMHDYLKFKSNDVYDSSRSFLLVLFQVVERGLVTDVRRSIKEAFFL